MRPRSVEPEAQPSEREPIGHRMTWRTPSGIEAGQGVGT